MFHHSQLRDHDYGGAGAWRHARRQFQQRVLKERNRLCVEVQNYSRLTNRAKRRLQERLLHFIENENHGRVVQRVRGHPGNFHVVSRPVALSIMGKMLYEGPTIVVPGPGDNDDDDDDVSIDSMMMLEVLRLLEEDI